MNIQDHKDWQIAVGKAGEVVKPLRAELAKAREAFSVAKAEVSRLDAECIKVWNDSLSDALKEPETP